MHISGYRYRRMHMALVGFGALPFVIWSFRTRSVWPEFATAAYLVTAALALTLLIGYPGPRSGWYWKVFGWTLVLHAAVLSMLAAGALAVVTTETAGCDAVRTSYSGYGWRIMGGFAFDRWIHGPR